MLDSATKAMGDVLVMRGRAWQRMLSGRRLNLVDPSPFDVEAEDIALGLSRVARWNGQTAGSWAFSVAQHCLLVEALLDRARPPSSPACRLAALLHDAPEFVIGDMITPFKSVLGEGYKHVEARLLMAVHLRFGLPAHLPPLWQRRIKRADRWAAHLEATQLAGFSRAEALDLFGAPPPGVPISLEPSAPNDSRTAYVDRLNALLRAYDQAAQSLS